MSRIRRPGLNYDVELMRAMGDETRRSILSFLCTPGAGCMQAYTVTEIAENVDLAASTVSHHLQTLRRSGLVDVQRCGRERHYSMQLGALRTYVTQFYDQLRIIDGAMERKARLGSQQPEQPEQAQL